jgi:hypothetical protein
MYKCFMSNIKCCGLKICKHLLNWVMAQKKKDSVSSAIFALCFYG